VYVATCAMPPVKALRASRDPPNYGLHRTEIGAVVRAPSHRNDHHQVSAALGQWADGEPERYATRLGM
jgi:hypothetical protein